MNIKKIQKSFIAILCVLTTLAAAGCGGGAAQAGGTARTGDAALAGETAELSGADSTETAEDAAQTEDAATAEDAAQTEDAAQAEKASQTEFNAFTDAPEEGSAEWRSSDTEQGAQYYEKEFVVFDSKLTDQTVTLRFYKEAPHVAYMGIRQYFDLMLGGGLDVEADGDGRYTLVNRSGASAEVDVPQGIMRIEDLPSFENYTEAAQKGERSSFKDSSAPFLRLREVEYLDEPQPVELDFESCGIALHADAASTEESGEHADAASTEESGEHADASSTEESGEHAGTAESAADVWFPVSILGSLLSDIAQNTVSFNGERLYICRQSTGYDQDGSYFDTKYMDEIMSGGERPADLAAYSYGELCFIFRYIYGYPGRTTLDEKILREEGLDAALAAAGEEGNALREELKSVDFREFWKGMFMLSQTVLEDGHNRTELTMDLGDPGMTQKRRGFEEYTNKLMTDMPQSEFFRTMMNAFSGISGERPDSFYESPYYTSGDTQVIRFNSFYVDEDDWRAYYEHDGGMPQDTVGVVAKGLQIAGENPDIRNVLFDVSTNLGGNTDVEIALLSLMTGKKYLSGYNELSKQRFRVYFDIDRNLDGVFDEKDKEVSYDLNYGALTSKASFSCGNMFPFLVREAGGVLVGDTSGGGSCSVQVCVLSEGFEFNVSGYKFKLSDDAGSDFEAGAKPDIVIEIGQRKTEDEFTGEEVTMDDYSGFVDIDGICRQVSDWFAKQ